MAGPQYWGVIHNIAAQYPDNPTETDKRQTRQFFNYLLDNFVCFECVKESKEYLSRHPIDLDSRKGLTQYFEDMHNTVNAKLGKPQFAIELKSVSHDAATCPTCKVGLKKNFDDFKTTSRNLILNMCKEANVEPPSIHFQPCPDNTSTSCLVYDNNKMADGVYVGAADVYINPYSASIRTIGHETKHYIDLKKGNPITEGSADDFAIEKINKHFDFDSYKNEVGQNRVMDEATTVKDVNDNNIQLLPLKNDIFAKKMTKYDRLGVTTSYDYPSLQRINNMLDKGGAPLPSQGGEVVQNALVIEDNTDDFILGSLNKFFEWPATLVGVKPSSLNQLYVGSFVTNVLQYLIQSNLSTFGASAFSLTTAILAFIGSAIFKNSIGAGDRLVIQGVIAMFLASGINNLVPKKRDVMAEGLRLFVEGVKEMDLEKLKQAFFFDEATFSIGKSVNSPDISKNTLFKNDISNALLGDVPTNPAMMVNPLRKAQIAGIKNYDNRIMGSGGFMTGDKNTIAPNYSNSTLESIANSYAKKRVIPGGLSTGTNLEGIDLGELTDELNEIAGMEIDTNTYEIMPM